MDSLRESNNLSQWKLQVNVMLSVVSEEVVQPFKQDEEFRE